MTRTAPLAATGTLPVGLDGEAAYRALASRDARFDGTVWFGVTSTGIYCRPVCPAQTPLARNVRLFVSPAAAVTAGFRACRRCRPDAAPGSRHWDHRGDLAARALRLVADGVVDAEGVAGLAARLHVSERHVHRTLVAEVGVGALALAISRRAQTARLLIDQTELSLSDVAFASGFASVRQFNDVMRQEFGVPPSALRGLRGRRTPAAAAPALVLRLPWRTPYDVQGVGAFLAARSVSGAQLHQAAAGAWRHERVVRLPHGPAVLVAEPSPDAEHLVLRVRGADLRDTADVVARVRRWLDLDADPDAIGAALSLDPWMAPLVAGRPGLRVCTGLDGFEGVVRAVVGQQVSVAAAMTMLGRLVERLGAPVPDTDLRAFPSADAMAGAAPDALAGLGLTGARRRTLLATAEAVASGHLALDRGADREEVLSRLRAIPGVGEWTTSYVALRVLADPDAFPATDLVLRRAGQGRGLDPADLAAHAERHWRPWRAYAAGHLWTADIPGATR